VSNSVLKPPAFRGIWRDDAEARAVYSEAAGIHQIVPRAVAVAADANDVVALVRWAAEHHVPLTPRGSGSSMAGGAVGAGVVVDLSRMSAIGAVNATTRSVIVGPGAICADVDAAAQQHGLRFPVDPSSARFCTVGGMAATNAAGGRTLRFGQMNAWVEGVECVFADGSRAWVRRGAPLPDAAPLARFAGVAPALMKAERAGASRHAGVRKESSGYALASWAGSGSVIDLLVGSEGTLALFTALELRLAPIPAARATIVAAFSSIDGAAAAASVAAELNASACELLDRTFLEIARRGGPLPVPDGADAVLLVEVEDTSGARVAELVHAMAVAFADAGALHVESAVDAAHAAKLWRLRHAASPILAGMSRAAISMQVVEDGAVPPAKLPDYVRGLRALLARSQFGGVIFGHAGDGHVHANVLVDVSEPDWRERVERVFDGGVALIVSLGGTTTGEHGDGRLRAGALPVVWPAAAMERFRVVKSAFDPLGILNPGVKLPASDAPPLGGPNKYDPQLAPLPAAARAALDRVQRERAWGEGRLELLGETRDLAG
jgi:FAD/FMN-containing dehydrogenase